MKDPLLLPELRELLSSNDVEGLKKFCQAGHPTAIADFLSALTPPEIRRVLSVLDPVKRAEIFSNLDEEVQNELVRELPRRELAEIFTHMPHDERAQLFQRLSEEEKASLLPALAQAEREDIKKLSSYEPGTAGAVMTSDYATLSPDLTADEAIRKLRHEAPDKETIYYAYVVDDKRRLLGIVSLKDLILAPPNKKISEIMSTDIIYARVDEDQEEAARKISKYDLIAIPVINGNDALVGIITHDDAIDIINQEHTEDMEKFMAIAGKHSVGTYLRTPAFRHFRNRAGWIVGLAIAGFVSGAIIQSFEDTLRSLVILALYMPMIADTGGNTGSQAATVVIQALARGEISLRDFGKVLFKEFQVSLLLAVVVAAVSYIKVVFISQDATVPPEFTLAQIAGVIAIALALQVVTATLTGALLPMLAVRFDKDPAVVASPAITTLVDITGLLIYFYCAKLFLGV